MVLNFSLNTFSIIFLIILTLISALNLNSDKKLESELEESSDNILELVFKPKPEFKVIRFTLPFLNLLFFFLKYL